MINLIPSVIFPRHCRVCRRPASSLPVCVRHRASLLLTAHTIFFHSSLTRPEGYSEYRRLNHGRNMAKKAASATLAQVSTQITAESAGATRRDGEVVEGSLATDPVPTMRVNKANLGEIKSAIDDIVKKVRRAIRVVIRVTYRHSLVFESKSPLVGVFARAFAWKSASKGGMVLLIEDKSS